MANKKRILVVSYFANMPGACQAEWVDDKIKALLTRGHEITLVSSICARPYYGNDYSHMRVPSMSWHDFKDELTRIKNDGFNVDWYLYLLIPIILVFGSFTDGLQYLLTKGIGEGRWSWIATSFIAEFVAIRRYKSDIILSTGGPASAHLSSILVSKILRKPVVIELQDPLSGGSIGRNEAAAGWLYKVEKLIVKYADKTVYVTKSAADFARQQFKSTKIVSVYPGAWDFKIYPSDMSQSASNLYKMVHLGSLYATRNFRSIIKAIDLLIANGEFKESEIELLNLGHVAPEIRAEIDKKNYVKVLPPVSRVDALKVAANCSVMLLIQNQDKRSEVTIPYKTYDYLNVNNRILGILNSQELTTLLQNAGHLAFNLDDIEGIAEGLKRLLKGEAPSFKGVENINSIEQAEKLIDLGFLDTMSP